MPIYTTATWLSLGTFDPFDVFEGDFNSENANVLLGQTLSSAQTLSLVTVTGNDNNNDGIIRSDDNGQTAESFTVDGITSNLDSEVVYNVTVTYGNGSTAAHTVAVVQLADGRTFIDPTSETQFDNASIQAITFNSIVKSDYSGINNTSIRSIDNSQIVCFAAGTLIATPQGPRAVESLAPGDMVDTLDDGPQPLVWTGAQSAEANGRTAPVLFRAGHYGAERDLMVSPQHRMLLRGPQLELMFGSSEMLAPAAALVDGQGVLRRPGGQIGYHHLMFTRHQLVLANGAPSESFYPGAQALRALSGASLRALLALYPELARQPVREVYGPPARPCLRMSEARLCRIPARRPQVIAA